MTWLQYFKNDDEDMLSFLISLALLLTLVACQKPVGERPAKMILIPLEVIAVIFALKTRQAPLNKKTPHNCSAAQQGNTSFHFGGDFIRMTLRPPTYSFESGELPPLT